MIRQPVATSVYQEAGITEPLVVEKRWGQERTFMNGEGTSTRYQTGYCMKELWLKPGDKGSLHFHLHKHETLYIIGPSMLTIEWADGKGNSGTTNVGPGEAFVIPPGFQHRLCAYDGEVTIIEASTIDDPNDSIRVSM